MSGFHVSPRLHHPYAGAPLDGFHQTDHGNAPGTGDVSRAWRIEGRSPTPAANKTGVARAGGPRRIAYRRSRAGFAAPAVFERVPLHRGASEARTFRLNLDGSPPCYERQPRVPRRNAAMIFPLLRATPAPGGASTFRAAARRRDDRPLELARPRRRDADCIAHESRRSCPRASRAHNNTAVARAPSHGQAGFARSSLLAIVDGSPTRVARECVA
jgi:hypothetical protein